MDGVRAGDVGGADDVGRVEIAVFGGRRADADRLIRPVDMQGIGIGGRVDGDGLDAQLFARADDADGDLAAIGNQNLFEHPGSEDSPSVVFMAWMDTVYLTGLRIILIRLVAYGAGEHLRR